MRWVLILAAVVLPCSAQAQMQPVKRQVAPKVKVEAKAVETKPEKTRLMLLHPPKAVEAKAVEAKPVDTKPEKLLPPHPLNMPQFDVPEFKPIVIPDVQQRPVANPIDMGAFLALMLAEGSIPI